MTVQDYEPADRPALEAMWATQFGNLLPDLTNSLFIVKLVVAGDDGKPVMAALAKLTAELHLTLNRSVGTPRDRWNWFRMLHSSIEVRIWNAGLEDAHAHLHPAIKKSFSRRLESLGWRPEHEAWWHSMAFPTSTAT